MTYVELHCHSAYSFLDGASQPEELAARAAELGYTALALTDHDGVYGSLEFAQAAKALGVRPITGAELTLATEPPSHITVLVETPRGYANLCRLITASHSQERRNPMLGHDMFGEFGDGLICLSGCAREGVGVMHPNIAAELARTLGPEHFYVELQRPYAYGDTRRNHQLKALARELRVKTVATGNVHAHHARRTRLQDVLVAIREGTTLDGCEVARRGNEEFVLTAPEEAEHRFPNDLDAVRATSDLAERLEFDLTKELGYQYPDFSDGDTSAEEQLAEICSASFDGRYRHSPVRIEARARLEEELDLIAALDLSGFFLLHHEVLEIAREVAHEVRGPSAARQILPPGRGRGSSVGSIVCYLTGLSHVDPVGAGLSLGRFLNRELKAVPDIDLDFPRDIRAALIARLIQHYGRAHTALVATFPTYRSRGAIREVGKAFGLPNADLERLARLSDGWDATNIAQEISHLPDADEKQRSPRWRAFAEVCGEIAGLPRHLSQHPGGMIISSRPLVELVPVEHAAMSGRQLCQWDKDSCGDAGFLKIDLLGLGMLSAVEECADQIAQRRSEPIDLSRIPLDDVSVYSEIRDADTVGVFQIESRAQMQSLLRTQPENLDDLTVQVALVRPGPIQGGAVNPYIERRQRRRRDPTCELPIDHPLLREPLKDTLGVVVFQDQVLDVAIALAGFTVGEAEDLRRAMSRKRSHDAIESYRERFLAGAMQRSVSPEIAEAVFQKLLGFASFGFPKSHAAAFALLAYQSAWLRHHYPAEFLCALLNAQPMGFYPPSSLVRDGERRGVKVRTPDINLSNVHCVLEKTSVRVGLGFIRGVGKEAAAQLVAEREVAGPFASVHDLAQRAPLSRAEFDALVVSGACDLFGWPRRQLLWRLGLAPRSVSAGEGGEARQLVLPIEPTTEIPELPDETVWERVLSDYRSIGLSTGQHPIELLRAHLPKEVLASCDLPHARHGEQVAVAGMVVARQRPSTANGIIFMLLEDEHGHINLVIPPPIYDKYRAYVRGEPLLLARGRFEHIERNRNIVVNELASLAELARQASGETELLVSLPRAHSFGRR